MAIEIAGELSVLKEKNLYRDLRIFERAPGRLMRINNNEYINFSSNNYLGLSNHPAVKEAAIEAIHKFGAGASASRLISGTLAVHAQLEQKLAEFKKCESALVFPTGFQTSLGVITSLVSKEDAVILDRLCHASLIDAVRLSGAKLLVYPHVDYMQLDKVLHKLDMYKKKLVVTDGVFSMDGDVAPLNELSAVCKKYNAILLVDDAHGTGVLGDYGRGSLEFLHVNDTHIIVMGTLSKALGSQGGFVCGSKNVISLFINKARSFIYTTGLNPGSCGAALQSLEIIKTEPLRRKNLLHNAEYLRDKLHRAGYNTLHSVTNIIPVLIGDINETLNLSKKLMDNGIYCPAIRPPTVPNGLARLRVSLISDHTLEDIDTFVSILDKG
ncbi:MAG: 8-amino-7-oxononanoate synthase [bacterium]